MLRILLLIFSFGTTLLFAQSELLIGTVVSEFEDKLSSTLIINMRSEERVISDQEGNFLIKVAIGDELRFIRSNYERGSLIVSADNFTKPNKIRLKALEYLIPELELGFVPSGNLKKDVLRLETSTDRKIASLNDNLNQYVHSSDKVILPKNDAGNSFKSTQNLNYRSLDIIALIGGISKLVSKNTSSTTTANYTEREAFYKKVRSVINVDYFANAGIKDYDLDRLIAYADIRYDLAKNYRNNFNKAVIEDYLKLAINDFKVKIEGKGVKTGIK